jgi:hypothetical protein
MRAESGSLDETKSRGKQDEVNLKLSEKVPLPKSNTQSDMEAVISPQAVLTRRMTSQKERSYIDNVDPVSDIYPMPKWPVNHVSAAFDAVAVKKSLVLSPAEIYAECAHHGKYQSSRLSCLRWKA